MRQGIPVYKITDYDGDPIEGTFYESELQKVNKHRDDLWKKEKFLKRRKRGSVKEHRDDLWKKEKFLKRRKRGSVKEVYVKWSGFPKKFSSWIKENDLQYV